MVPVDMNKANCSSSSYALDTYDSGTTCNKAWTEDGEYYYDKYYWLTTEDDTDEWMLVEFETSIQIVAMEITQLETPFYQTEYSARIDS